MPNKGHDILQKNHFLWISNYKLWPRWIHAIAYNAGYCLRRQYTISKSCDMTKLENENS